MVFETTAYTIPPLAQATPYFARFLSIRQSTLSGLRQMRYRQSMATILTAAAILASQETTLHQRIADLARHGVMPKLVDYWIGDDRASAVFLDVKQKKAAALGVSMEIRAYPSGVAPTTVLSDFAADAESAAVHGLMVQVPVPMPHSLESFIHHIPRPKDVDGLRQELLFPAPVAEAVLSLLRDFDYTDKTVALVGHGSTAGQPLARMLRPILEHQGGRLLIIEQQTANPEQQASKADLLITAASAERFVGADWIKPGAWVIDIASNTKGPEVEAKASHINAVRGSVGPLTVYFLMANTVRAAEEQSADKLR